MISVGHNFSFKNIYYDLSRAQTFIKTYLYIKVLRYLTLAVIHSLSFVHDDSFHSHAVDERTVSLLFSYE